jgi:hypothetical protein
MRSTKPFPCPHCGSPVRVIAFDDGVGVSCSESDCWEGPVLPNEQEAIAEWNRVAGFKAVGKVRYAN